VNKGGAAYIHAALAGLALLGAAAWIWRSTCFQALTLAWTSR